MLAPLVGGSMYSLGLILSIILLGIGVGGAIGSSRRSIFFLAFLFGLQGLAISFPYILGDHVALLALGLKSLENLGFWGRVFGWALLVGLVTFPASVIAGITFPSLISAMGEGKKNIAVHTGRLYFWNTTGAILGSFLSGFLLIPASSAPGVWRMIALLFFLPGAVGMLFSMRRHPLGATGFLLMFGLGICLVFSVDGPTAAWRHSPIGAGRQAFDGVTPNGIKDWLHFERRQMAWEADGIESCIGVMAANGYSLIINGKSDGNVIADAETMVVLGLIPAILQGKPEQALVIGLGTGLTAGWLAAVDSVKQVDVLELESKVTHIASLCGPANFQMMHNPKVTTHIGDAREWVLTTGRTYDVIVSEPSNPYRAGVASLFSREFYQAVARILRSDGVYAQWVQGYEIGFPTFLSIYATMRAVFPAVEIWTSGGHDLLLVASLNQRHLNAPVLRQTLALEPYKTALERIARVEGLEGFLSLFLVNSDFYSLVQALPKPMVEINTDDRLVVEFGFARSVGMKMAVRETDLLRVAAERGMGRPVFDMEGVNWKRVDEFRITHLNALLKTENLADDIELAAKNNAWKAYGEGRFDSVALAWDLQSKPPETPMTLLMLAESYAQQGDSRALPLIEQVKARGWPEADGLGGLYLYRQGYPAEATVEWKKLFLGLKQDPWLYKPLVERIMKLWANAANSRPEMRDSLVEGLGEPFAVGQLQEGRRMALVDALSGSEDPRMIKILEEYEPHIPWNRKYLDIRLAHYLRTNHHLKQRAAEDVEEFSRLEPFGVSNLFRNEPEPR